jgi:hypothetical protein
MARGNAYESLVFSPEVADIITQDVQIHTIKDTQETASRRFWQRLDEQADSYIRQLDAVMVPLVGDSDKIHELHKKIASLANQATRDFHAYTGTFELVRPLASHEFEPHFHQLDHNQKARRGRRIQLATNIGIKFKLPDYKDWRICAKAVVELYPE